MTAAGFEPLDNAACYRALTAHDSRFDGRFFVGVSSTGIYCRPVCRVKTPKAGNCAFFPSAAAAEAEGYRPCRKCRPELAPGLAPIDAAACLVRRVVRIVEEGCLDESGPSALAARLGVSDRHVRRLFVQAFGVPPIRYLQTRRLLLAKSLLTDTRLPITDVAFASGFGSVRRFNDLFRKRYRLTPSSLRSRRRDPAGDAGDGIVLRLGYRSPFRWESLLGFFARRAIPGLESVDADVYRRTVEIETNGRRLRGWIAVRDQPRENALEAFVSRSLLPVLPKIASRIRAMFDLDCDPEAVCARLSVMNRVRPGLCVPGTRVPGCFDSFEMAVRAILGQQVTTTAARTLAMRVARDLGETIATPFAGLERTFPSPETVARLGDGAAARLGGLGIIRARSRAIGALAEAMASGELILDSAADPGAEMARLSALPGFGPWTINYVAMRTLGWPDAFLRDDWGVKKALPGVGPADRERLAESWRPWRAYAVVNLWNSL